MSYLADDVYAKDYVTLSAETISTPTQSQSYTLDIKEGCQNETVYEPLENPTARRSPLPQLNTFKARNDEDIAAALRIVSDGVAQQQQLAVKSIITHPAVVGTSIMIFLTIAKLLYTGVPSDFVLMLALWTLCALVGLVTIKILVDGYIDLACEVGNMAWLSDNTVGVTPHRRDEVILTSMGDEIVGAVVFRLTKTAHSPQKSPHNSRSHRSSRRKSSIRWTAVIRAWTVKHEYQCQGIGTTLLEETVQYAKLKGLNGPVFAEDHAASQMILPGIFNSKFRDRDRWARALLEYVINKGKA